MPDPAAALAEFVTYVGTHLAGDEKREAAGESITPPGLPLPVEDHTAFITDDCIRAD